jgi:hypothetical protein
MAGFPGRDEIYYLPRAYIDLPHGVDYYAGKLLPNLVRWKREYHARRRGQDNQDCCGQFLHVLLPYLVTVLVQDGVFFIVDFPNHPVATMLKVSTTTNQYDRLLTNVVLSISFLLGNSRFQCLG